MQHKKLLFFLQSSGVILITIGVLLIFGQPVDAQCGSQASSCKNCHEVQAVDPVNNDGTGWHVSHAFGDFCTICHAGNAQSTDETEAHTGMVAPLEDVEASCQMCHADDLEARAQVYATALNISFGRGGGSSASSSSDAPGGSSESDSASQTTDESSALPQVAIGIPMSNELAVDDPNLVDYVQRYNEIVLGERPVNVGNIVLVVLIGMIVVLGGGFVLINEMRINARAHAPRMVEGDYPADVVEMLPGIAQLKADTRKSLGKLIKTLDATDKPESAE